MSSSFPFSDNVNMKHSTIDQQLDDLERILERSRLFNVTWKLGDTIIGVSKEGRAGSGQKMDVLGFSVGRQGEYRTSWV